MHGAGNDKGGCWYGKGAFRALELIYGRFSRNFVDVVFLQVCFVNGK